MVLKLNKNIFYDISLFRICYTISLLFEIVAVHPVEILAGWVNGITFIWGIFICLHMMFNEPYKFKIENKNVAFLFIILGIFTSCLNFSNNILPFFLSFLFIISLSYIISLIFSSRIPSEFSYFFFGDCFDDTLLVFVYSVVSVFV